MMCIDRRLSGDDFAAPVVVTGDPFRLDVNEQLAQVSLATAATLIDPEARNTAPAVLAAALWLAEQDPDALMVASLTDHITPDAPGFRVAIATPAPAAVAGAITTLGIRRKQPKTGYSYLELAGRADTSAMTVQRLTRFVEKPDTERAEAMASSGRYL